MINCTCLCQVIGKRVLEHVHRSWPACAFFAVLWYCVQYLNILQGDWIHLIDFLPFFTREITFVASCLVFSSPSPFWKEVCSKRKEFAPKRSKFFHFREDPFQKGRINNFERIACLNSVSIPLRWPVKTLRVHICEQICVVHLCSKEPFTNGMAYLFILPENARLFSVFDFYALHLLSKCCADNLYFVFTYL